MHIFKRICFGLLLSCLITWDALAVPESVFQQEFAEHIMPNFWKNGESAFLTTPDGMKIHYRKFVKPGQEQLLVLLPGRTESTFKWAEFIYDLQAMNIGVIVIDHRGQGASGREVDDPQVQYIRDFGQYRDDINSLMLEVVIPLGMKKVFGMGHSMGANILALYTARHPEAFNKIVLTSPMLDINPAPWPWQWLGYAAATVACWMGFDKDFVAGHGHYDPQEKYRGTGSDIRFQAFRELRLSKPDELVGGVSYRFAQKAIEATWEMRQDAEKLTMPMLMFQAGNDDVVFAEGQDYVCQRAKQCRKVVVPNALHEIHVETDALRESWLQEIRRFLSEP